MYLVDDVNLVFSLRGAILHLLTDLADVVHAVVGGRIDLDDVHGDPAGNRFAGRALPTGASIHRVFTIHGLGKNLGNRSLSGSPRTTKQVCMPYTIRLYLIAKSSDDMILSFYIFKFLRTKFPIQRSI